jgi:hypothetical protein
VVRDIVGLDAGADVALAVLCVAATVSLFDVGFGRRDLVFAGSAYNLTHVCTKEMCDAAHVGRGNLHGIEEESCAFCIQSVGGHGADDVGDGGLDGLGILKQRDFQRLALA